jgi:hypothetical protein
MISSSIETKAVKRIVFIALLLFTLQISTAYAITACEASGDIVKIGTQGFEVNWSNWRVYLAIALALSILLIFIIRTVSSVIKEEGLIARSRSELFQLIMTAVIALFFVAFFQFLCSPALPSIFGFTDNIFDRSETYLKDMASWTRYSFFEIFTALALQNFYDSFSEKTAGQNPVTWGLGGALSTVVPRLLLSMFLFAHMSANLHIQLLQFLQPYTLIFLIPAGLVLRSFFPFRKFGGALLGAGIALIVIFPFLIMLDSLILGEYFKQASFLDLSCDSNVECLSKVCDTTKHLCQNSLPTGADCGSARGEAQDALIGDLQCMSNRCVKGKCADPAVLLGDGAPCSKDKECEAPLWCDLSNTPKQCAQPLKTGSSCGRDAMCGASNRAFCNSSRVCAGSKAVGDSCEDNRECASLYCSGVPPNKACVSPKYDLRQIAINVGEAGISGGGSLPAQLSISRVLSRMVEIMTIGIVGGIVLPLINYLLLSRAVRDFSAFFGSEIDIASIYRIL